MKIEVGRLISQKTLIVFIFCMMRTHAGDGRTRNMARAKFPKTSCGGVSSEGSMLEVEGRTLKVQRWKLNVGMRIVEG